MLSRRQLFAYTTAGTALLATGCSSASPTTVADQIAQAAQDVALVVNGLQAIVPTILAQTGVSATVATQVKGYLADLANLATELAAAATQSQAQSIVTQVESDVNAVITAMAGLPLPTQASQVIQAISVTLPLVEQILNMTVTQVVAPTPAPAPTTAAAPAPMNSQQAIQVLIHASVTR